MTAATLARPAEVRRLLAALAPAMTALLSALRYKGEKVRDLHISTPIRKHGEWSASVADGYVVPFLRGERPRLQAHFHSAGIGDALADARGALGRIMPYDPVTYSISVAPSFIAADVREERFGDAPCVVLHPTAAATHFLDPAYAELADAVADLAVPLAEGQQLALWVNESQRDRISAHRRLEIEAMTRRLAPSERLRTALREHYCELLSLKREGGFALVLGQTIEGEDLDLYGAVALKGNT